MFCEKDDAFERSVWAAVIKRGVDDYRTVMRYKQQDELTEAEERNLAKIYSYGGDPEAWIFGERNGFDEICRYVGRGS